MRIVFNGKEYKKNGRKGSALKNLCFDIFQYYLEQHKGLSYQELQNTFNQYHCNNNYVVLSEEDWQNKTEDLKSRYFDPITYNSQNYYFTTQWGNNGANCDNIDHMIDFAIKHGYDIKILEDERVKTKVTTIKQQDNISTKNIMLYGAPGVGKTHNYKKLVSLIEGGDFSESDIFDFIINNKDDEIEEGSVEELFETVTKEKRIEFVTFHQSYSYEDFIEGFRPNEEGKIQLDRNGIFKSIADKARINLNESKKDLETIKGEQTFQEIFELYKDLIQDEIDKNQKFIINDTAYIINIEDDAFRYTGDQWGNTQRMKFNDIESLNELGISDRKDIKKAEGLSGLANQHATYFSYFMKKFQEFKYKQNIKIEKNDIQKIEQKNFYIVIDEINRGNISKIFGELITLIEEDKRDSYEVTLPYSKEKFKIPSNLYIIATMNSTDKSIATIDIALRRRFTFLKMKPNDTLIEYPDAKDLFNKLNKFIADNLNEDYQLGHSYFMKVTNDQELEFVKKYKIKPLLEEYFYVDEKKQQEAINILYVSNDI